MFFQPLQVSAFIVTKGIAIDWALSSTEVSAHQRRKHLVPQYAFRPCEDGGDKGDQKERTNPSLSFPLVTANDPSSPGRAQKMVQPNRCKSKESQRPGGGPTSPSEAVTSSAAASSTPIFAIFRVRGFLVFLVFATAVTISVLTFVQAPTDQMIATEAKMYAGELTDLFLNAAEIRQLGLIPYTASSFEGRAGIFKSDARIWFTDDQVLKGQSFKVLEIRDFRAVFLERKIAQEAYDESIRQQQQRFEDGVSNPAYCDAILQILNTPGVACFHVEVDKEDLEEPQQHIEESFLTVRIGNMVAELDIIAAKNRRGRLQGPNTIPTLVVKLAETLSSSLSLTPPKEVPTYESYLRTFSAMDASAAAILIGVVLKIGHFMITSRPLQGSSKRQNLFHLSKSSWTSIRESWGRQALLTEESAPQGKKESSPVTSVKPAASLTAAPGPKPPRGTSPSKAPPQKGSSRSSRSGKGKTTPAPPSGSEKPTPPAELVRAKGKAHIEDPAAPRSCHWVISPSCESFILAPFTSPGEYHSSIHELTRKPSKPSEANEKKKSKSRQRASKDESKPGPSGSPQGPAKELPAKPLPAEQKRKQSSSSPSSGERSPVKTPSSPKIVPLKSAPSPESLSPSMKASSSRLSGSSPRQEPRRNVARKLSRSADFTNDEQAFATIPSLHPKMRHAFRSTSSSVPVLPSPPLPLPSHSPLPHPHPHPHPHPFLPPQRSLSMTAFPLQLPYLTTPTVLGYQLATGTIVVLPPSSQERNLKVGESQYLPPLNADWEGRRKSAPATSSPPPPSLKRSGRSLDFMSLDEEDELVGPPISFVSPVPLKPYDHALLQEALASNFWLSDTKEEPEKPSMAQFCFVCSLRGHPGQECPRKVL